MKKLLFLILMITPALMLSAQGVQFQDGTWADVVKSATAANKMIYLDVYTTWCGPCKMLDKMIFPDSAVGAAYNDKFINYKVDAEKGEGIALAKKFKVTGYPTGLFLSPDGEKLIYKTMGFTDKEAIIHRAEVAVEERKDPMTWERYMAEFKKGNRDKPFLEKFLEKADRLQKNNDSILDAYVNQYVKGTPDSNTLQFLYKNTQTLDNQSYEIVYQNAEALHKADSYFVLNKWLNRLAYSTLEKATNNKDEAVLNRLIKAIDRYNFIDNFVYGKYFYQSTYFERTGQAEKLSAAYVAEADFLMRIPEDKMQALDKNLLEEAKAGIIAQLKAMNVPESSWDASVKATIAQHPQLNRQAHESMAIRLNAAAWNMVENKVTDKEKLAQAMKWSEKSMTLLDGSPDWSTVTDTYANLLYISGEKDKAIQTEKEALAKAEDSAKAEFQATLDKMEKGTL